MDTSYKNLSAKELYEQLTEEDQNRFKEIFTKTEDWKEQSSKLFDPRNQEALENQLNMQFKRNLAKNTGALYYVTFTAEEVNASRRLSEELFKNIYVPASANYHFIKRRHEIKRRDEIKKF